MSCSATRRVTVESFRLRRRAAGRCSASSRFSFAPGALDLTSRLPYAKGAAARAAANWIVLLLTVGFGVLLSAWPLHVWRRPPTPPRRRRCMFSAGVLKQLAAYGLLRLVLPLLPAASVPQWSRALAAVAVMNILYIGWITLRQTDGKKLIAWASVSHAGYLLLGLAALNSIAHKASH